MQIVWSIPRQTATNTARSTFSDDKVFPEKADFAVFMPYF